MFNLIKYIKEYFTSRIKEDSCEFDFQDSPKNVSDKGYDIEVRAYNRLSKQYKDFYDLSQVERNSLLYDEIKKLRQEDGLEESKQKRLLRTIKTLRTKEEIEDAVKAGHKVLKQEVKPSEDIHVTDLHIKDKKTGEIEIKPYSYYAIPLDNDRYEVIKEVTYYPYNFPSKVAAYLLPDDLAIGERVILEDLIEDIVGTIHSLNTYRLNSTEAIWNGEKFVVDCCHSRDADIPFG